MPDGDGLSNGGLKRPLAQGSRNVFFAPTARFLGKACLAALWTSTPKSRTTCTRCQRRGTQAVKLGRERFLPWHRIYLFLFEKALPDLDPSLAIPYWDWKSTSQLDLPHWVSGFTDPVKTPLQAEIPMWVAPGDPKELNAIAQTIPTVLQHSAYTELTRSPEIARNLVHLWVDGIMSQIPTAPVHPIFWMHQANLDRQWWTWQESRVGQGKHPNLPGGRAVLDPWGYR